MEKQHKLVSYLKGLANLTDQEEELLAKSFHFETVKAKEFLQAQGEVCNKLFYLISGMVRAGVQTEDGDDATIYFQGENNFVSDYESFLKERPSEFFIQAIDNLEVLSISKANLLQIYSSTANGDRLGRLITEKAFIITNQRLVSFYTQSAEERYRKLMESVPELLNRVPQNYIASFIGVKPQSFSRIKRRLIEEAKQNK